MTVYIIACILIAAVFGGAYYTYRIAFYSPSRDRDKIPPAKGPQYDPHREKIDRLFHQLYDRPCEYVTIRTPDGLTLSGRYYHVKDGAPLDIGFHGYRSSAMTDFCGGSELSFQLEHNVLLVDQRSHGKSQGRTITFGIKERQDLLCWVHYAVERFGAEVQIILYGVSMGGATVLMASELELPPNVKAIIADCPYSSPRDIILAVGKKMGFSPKLIWPFVVLGARVYGGFDINEVTAESAVRHAKVPILIIHGEADGFVPHDMSRVIQEANPEKVARHTFPGADHGISYLVDTPGYQKIVTEFMNEVL